MNEHNVGDLVMAIDFGNKVVGVITRIINYEDGSEYQIDWSDGDRDYYSKSSINGYKIILEREN